MRRALAMFLLVCFGIMLPMAASPARICLMDGSILLSGGSFGKASCEESKCCKDCRKKEKQCCAELKKLPDSNLPAVSPTLPPVIAMDFPVVIFAAAPEAVEWPRVHHPSVPIRGPDSPSAHRAVLAIWRI